MNDFTKLIETEKRSDGWYARMSKDSGIQDEWHGAWDTQYIAIQSMIRVFNVGA
jgi:hypothetical protein